MATEATMRLLVQQFGTNAYVAKAEQIAAFVAANPSNPGVRIILDVTIPRLMMGEARATRLVGGATIGIEANADGQDIIGVALATQTPLLFGESFIRTTKDILGELDKLRVIEDPTLVLTNRLEDLP